MGPGCDGRCGLIDTTHLDVSLPSRIYHNIIDCGSYSATQGQSRWRAEVMAVMVFGGASGCLWGALPTDVPTE